MSKQFNILQDDGRPKLFNIDKFPDECPYCHKGIEVIQVQGFLVNNTLQIVFRCPRQDCHNAFFGYYKQLIAHDGPIYCLEKTSIGIIQEKQFSEYISSFSQDFSKIYNQSLIAESYNLDQIVGMGLRKAMEFLIKDYLINVKKIKKDSIENTLLAKCIENYIDDNRIKEMAKRAVWLGNDETHYVKKWDTKDINDLKLLIDATLHWIEMESITDNYMESMK